MAKSVNANRLEFCSDDLAIRGFKTGCTGGIGVDGAEDKPRVQSAGMLADVLKQTQASENLAQRKQEQSQYMRTFVRQLVDERNFSRPKILSSTN